MDDRNVADRIAAILTILTFAFILFDLDKSFVASHHPTDEPGNALFSEAAIESQRVADSAQARTEQQMPSAIEGDSVPNTLGLNSIEILETRFVTGTSQSTNESTPSK